MPTRFTVRALLRTVACTLIFFALLFHVQAVVMLYRTHQFLAWIQEVSSQ